MIFSDPLEGKNGAENRGCSGVCAADWSLALLGGRDVSAKCTTENRRRKIPVNEAMAIVEKLDADKAQEKEERAKAKAEKAQLLSFDEARAKKETYLAEIKEMEAKVMRGEYVAVADVKADARATAERLRSFCLSAPSRFAGLLENRNQRDVEAVLESMFNELLEKIHGGQFTADDEVKDGDLE